MSQGSEKPPAKISEGPMIHRNFPESSIQNLLEKVVWAQVPEME